MCYGSEDMVFTLWCSFTYYGRLSHVVSFCVSQSDTESGVLFALTATVQKLSYRRIVSLFLCAAIPLVDGPHGLCPYPHTCIVATSWHMGPSYRHYVHVIKRQGSCLTPAHIPSLRGATGLVFIEVSLPLSPWIRTRDLRIPSSLLCPCCHRDTLLYCL